MDTKYFNPKTVKPGTIPERVIQPKLEVNPPNDIYEKQADEVANRVSRMPGSASDNLQMQPKQDEEKKLQMKSEDEDKNLQMKPEEEDKKLQMKPEEDESISMQPEEEEKGKIQMSAGSSSNNQVPQVSSSLASQLNSTKGQGSPLSEGVSREMGQKIGGNFNNVRVHTDDNAVQMNKDLGAKAFTHGNDIYFNNGQYSPENSSGKHLLAHELTHTIQQGKPNTNIQRAWIPDNGWRYTPPVTVTRSIVEIQGIVATTPDGIYGPNTREAVKVYQQELKNNGLYTGDIDGKWGPLTDAAHLLFAVQGIGSTAPRRGYNCAGFAFKTFTWHNLNPTKAILATMTHLANRSTQCNPRDYKFWLWECDVSVTTPAGNTTGISRDFHIVGGQTGRNGEDPAEVMSKNGERPLEGPKPAVDWMPVSGPAIDQDGNPVAGYTWNITNVDEQCYRNSTLP
ncbi:MAG: DUF4157 domain-containing protein [Bacteroidales bacterium]|nr:DUF4157 domain-containing protein [Bacteroidales bacterium]